jgi:hypothetical protein
VAIKKVRSSKTVIYKRADIEGIETDLQATVEAALAEAAKPSDRKETIGDAAVSNIRRVIGSHNAKENMLFGSLYLYEVGKDVTFVIEDDDADEFLIEAQNPAVGLDDEDDTKRRELLESALYFAIWKNHVVVAQSAALKARDLENHLKWFASECTGMIEGEYPLALSDEPTQEARQKIQTLPVKNVELGTPISTEQAQAPDGVTFHRLKGRAGQAIAAFLGDEILNELKLEDALEDSNLEVTLSLRYKRKTTDSGHAALDHIARAMRHAEPEDTKVTTGSGTVIKGGLLKLTGHVRVDTYNGIVDSNDLYSEMKNWLVERIEEGSVG